MVKFFAVLMLHVAFVNAVAAADLLERVSSSRHEWKTVKQTLSADEKSLQVEIDCPEGIFPAIVKWNFPKCEEVTITLPGKQSCEGLSLDPPGKNAIDLKQSKGVTVVTNPDGVKIVFVGEGLKTLSGGGTFHFIDFYRR